MIMSTLMLASASGMNMAAATPGGRPPARKVICASSREKAMPVTICCSTISSSSQISVPGLRMIRIVEGRPHESLDLVPHGEFDRTDLQHLGAERGHFQHLLEGDAVEAPGFRDDARIGRIDAVDVGIDVAAAGLDRGGDGDGAGVRAAAAERRDAAGLLVNPLKAGDDRDFAARLETLDQSARRRCRGCAPTRASRRSGSALASPAMNAPECRSPAGRGREARP